MIRITKLTDYAVVMLAFMAENEDTVYQAKEIAEKTGINLPTAAKLLKNLTKKELLVSIRGAFGGYRLKNSPEDIRLIEIIEALEGRLAITECSLGHDHCPKETQCSIRTPWLHINDVIIKALSSIKLIDLVPTSPTPLTAVPVSGLDTFYIKNLPPLLSTSAIRDTLTEKGIYHGK